MTTPDSLEARVKQAMEPLLAERVSPGALAALAAARTASSKAPDAVERGLVVRPPRQAWARRWVVPGAIAAALVVGFAAPNVIDRLQPSPDWITSPDYELPHAGATLARALSETPSFGSAPLTKGRRIIPVATFVNHANELCRQFSFIGPSDRHTGLACHTSDKAWELVALTQGEPVSSGGADGTPPPGDPVSALAVRMSRGPALDRTAEAQALKRL